MRIYTTEQEGKRQRQERNWNIIGGALFVGAIITASIAHYISNKNKNIASKPETRVTQTYTSEQQSRDYGIEQ